MTGDHFKTSLLVVATCIVLLPGCANDQFVPFVPLAEPLAAPEDAKPSPIGFNKIRFAIRTGTPVIASQPQSLTGILYCKPPFGITQSGIRQNSFPTENYREIFFDRLQAQGYDVTGDPGRLFDEDEDMMRTIYSIGGTIVDVKLDICRERQRQNDLLLGQDVIYNNGELGKGYVQVEWTVFDLLNRRNAYKITTSGFAELKSANHEGMELLIEDSLGAAIHNLGADPEFHALVFSGTPPSRAPDTHDDLEENPLPSKTSQESVTLPATAQSNSSVNGRLEDIIKTAVVIQAANSHGSGFFITGDGHILTNAHVVGNADQVRVVTSGKEEKIIAEVLRVDRRRDVALLKLKDLPEDFKIRTLPVRDETPKIGEEVYAIGAPRLTQLQDTVTRGIVSANRIERRTGLPFIQADVDIYGGSSGGPLLDAEGNIIGLSVLGFIIGGEGALGGLNWFVPIGEALDTLDIDPS